MNNLKWLVLNHNQTRFGGFFFRPKFLKTKILKPKSQSQKHSRKTGTGGDATLVLFENHVVLRILYDLKAKSRGAKDFERDIVSLRVML